MVCYLLVFTVHGINCLTFKIDIMRMWLVALGVLGGLYFLFFVLFMLDRLTEFEEDEENLID